MATERIKTYIEGFDSKLNGGIPKGHVVLIAGEPGSMKSSVAFHMLYHSALQNQTGGVYVTLEQGRENLLDHMANLGMDITKVEKLLSVVDLSLIRKMCTWVKEELGADTPLHLTRFYPLYKLTKLPPTPVSLLERAREAALSVGLRYVYIGNVPGHPAWNTFCPGCGRPVILRTGYVIQEIRLNQGHCAHCGRPVPGIWS